MAVDFSKWDNEYDVNDLQKDVDEASKNEFKQIPVGKYVVKLDSLEIGESKNGAPMLKARLKVVEGEYKNQNIFYNQAINTGVGIHMANEFLRSVHDEFEVSFNGFADYNDLVLDIVEAVQEDGLKYTCELKKREYNGNQFDSPKITGILR